MNDDDNDDDIDDDNDHDNLLSGGTYSGKSSLTECLAKVRVILSLIMIKMVMTLMTMMTLMSTFHQEDHTLGTGA